MLIAQTQVKQQNWPDKRAQTNYEEKVQSKRKVLSFEWNNDFKKVTWNYDKEM